MDIDLVRSCSAYAFFPDVLGNFAKREKIDALKESILEHGILEPLVLETSGPRVEKYHVPYYLVDGIHRLQAATELGLDTVPVRFIGA